MVLSAGRVIAASRPPSPVASGHVDLLGRRWSYAELYRRQPAVRTVVSFLARNVAQLGLHAFEANAEDRKRIRTGTLATTLAEPAPNMTQYRWLYRVIAEIAIYDEHYSVMSKVGDRLSLLPVPVAEVTPVGGTWSAPEAYRIFGFEIPASEVFAAVGYSPSSLWNGISALESLRQVLAADAAAEVHREMFWTHGAKVSGVLERPADAPKWSPDAAARFRSAWDARYGATGSDAGGTPILEDGMTYKELGMSAKDSQYLESRQLTREEVAAVYHIAPPMVGILDNANYSNVKQFHSQLYQDTLGPTLTQVQQEIDRQIVPRTGTQAYVEFNIMAKLAGTFEEQAQIMSTAVGGPWLTRNEARTRLNLPHIDGGDELITPLNVTAGGQASPRDSAPKAEGRKASPIVAAMHEGHVAPIEKAMRGCFDRQIRTLRAKKSVTLDRDRWDRELADDLSKASMTTATTVVAEVARSTGETLSAEPMRGWLDAKARGMAEAVNDETDRALRSIDQLDEAVLRDDVFGPGRSETAWNMAKAIVGFAFLDTATRAGFDAGTKTWVVRARDSRHPHLNGETVPIDGAFSNGARWPGDSSAGADEAAKCQCDLIINPGG